MNKEFEKIIEKLEELKKAEIEREDLCDEEGCGDGEEIYEDGKSQGRFEQSVRIIEIVKKEAEQYEECYKDCGECEAYNKEKYHCPKFCKVIKETVKEIEENHNGWISCSEQLPEPIRPVLVTLRNWMNDKCFVRVGRFHTDHWKTDEGIVENSVVIAWKPLPQPYQPKGE